MTRQNDTDHYSHASWHHLLVIFIVALSLFAAFRWQPEVWIQSQISKQSKLHGFNIHYNSLQLDGFTVLFDHLSIQSHQLSSPVKLDSLSLNPMWSSLFGGNPGANIQANWNGQTVSAAVIKQADIIDIQSLRGDLDVALLQPLLAKKLPIPVKVSGKVQISGDIQLNASNGHPRVGKINLNWKAAAVDMPSIKMPLGDYKLTLQTDDLKRAWQWDLSGGTTLKLSGKGNLNTYAQNPAAWSINGMLQARADQNSPTLSALLGNQNKRFSLSGLITQPRLQAF